MKSKRMIAMAICLLMVFSCIPFTSIAHAEGDQLDFQELKVKATRLVSKMANSENPKVQKLFKVIVVAAKEEKYMGVELTPDTLVGVLEAAIENDSKNEKSILKPYLEREGMTVEQAKQSMQLFRLLKIFTKTERLEIINSMKSGKVPTLLNEEKALIAKINKVMPTLESDLKKINKNLDLHAYVFVLKTLQNKGTEPMITDGDDGKIAIRIPNKIGEISNVRGIVDGALKGLTISGYTYVDIDTFTDEILKVINSKKQSQIDKLKVIFAEYGLYKAPEADTVKPVITLNGDATITLKQGETYTDEGVTVTDNVDKDFKVLKTVLKDGKQVTAIDTNVSGTYTIKYNVTDAAGNKADEVTRTVIVIKVVEVNINDVKEEKTEEGTTQMTAEIPDLEIKDGKTEKAVVTVPVSNKVKEDLGISGDQKIEIELPPLKVQAGEKVEIKIKKSSVQIREGKKVLAIAIKISALEKSQTVELVLPVPQGINEAGAFHREDSRWAHRQATSIGGQLKFETNLSSVAIAEKVEVPTLKEKSKTSNSVTLEWDSTLNNATYEVFRDGNKVGATNANEKSYTVTGLSGSTAYTFKIRALDADQFESDFSNTVTATTNSTPSSSGGGGGGGGSSYSGTTVKANEAETVKRKDVIVKIPSNAFDQDMKVKIETVSEYRTGKLSMAKNTKLASKVYEITKSVEGNFKKEVKITLPFEKVDLEKYALSLCFYNEETNKWIELDDIKVNKDTVSGEVNHFTKFAVIATQKVVEPEVIELEVTVPKDVVGHWAEENIVELMKKGAVSGYPDGTFKPNNKITRAEFATIVVKAFDLKQVDGKVFADTKDHWAKDFIATASAYGIVSGYDADTFGANDQITREQMAVMIVKAAAIQTKASEAQFIDQDQISDWAKKYVAAAAEEKLVGGYPDNTFKPKANATRAEAMTIIANALK